MPALPNCLTIVLAAALALMAPTPQAVADTAPQSEAQSATAQLLTTLQTDQTFAVMLEEGKAYGASIEQQMFPGQGTARWATMVAAIYDPATLGAIFDQALATALADDPQAVATAQDFFASPLGQHILTAEIAARRTLLDEAAEEAAQVEAERLQADRDPKMRQIRDLIKAGDMIEQNVAGALSANLAFLQGMASVGTNGTVMDAESMMSEVWSQESDIRAQTELWLLPYLALAYRDLSQDDLKAYVAFSESPEGKRLNGALFTAYDQVFRKVSHDLGRAAALLMQGNDI